MSDSIEEQEYRHKVLCAEVKRKALNDVLEIVEHVTDEEREEILRAACAYCNVDPHPKVAEAILKMADAVRECRPTRGGTEVGGRG